MPSEKLSVDKKELSKLISKLHDLLSLKASKIVRAFDRKKLPQPGSNHFLCKISLWCKLSVDPLHIASFWSIYYSKLNQLPRYIVIRLKRMRKTSWNQNKCFLFCTQSFTTCTSCVSVCFGVCCAVSTGRGGSEESTTCSAFLLDGQLQIAFISLQSAFDWFAVDFACFYVGLWASKALLFHGFAHVRTSPMGGWAKLSKRNYCKTIFWLGSSFFSANFHRSRCSRDKLFFSGGIVIESTHGRPPLISYVTIAVTRSRSATQTQLPALVTLSSFFLLRTQFITLNLTTRNS